MPSSVRSFFKVILSSTFRDGKLKLPSKFVKEHCDELSGSVRLFIPVGRSWCVGVERDIDKTIWLQDGLLKFLEDNAVGIEYFLIFEYEGNSMFNVLIFDLTATEINYNSDSENLFELNLSFQEDTREGVTDEGGMKIPVECLDPSTDYLFPQISEEHSKSASRNKRWSCVTRETDNVTRCNVKTRKKQKLDGVIEVKARRDMGSQSYERLHKKSDACKGGRKAYNCPGENNSSKYRDTEKSEDNYIPPKEFTVERTDQAENMSFSTSFEVAMKAYNLERYILNVPTEFSKLNIPRSTSHIKLFDTDDNEWVIRCVHRNKSQCSFTKGWVCFVRDKKLMVGDVCVFERIGGGEVKLKVNIHRNADGKNSIMNKDTSTNDGTGASPRESTKERTIVAENKLSPSSFKVTLKRSNIESHILRVPSYFTPLIPLDSARVIKLVDADNNEWPVRYIYKPDTHVLTQGWIYFVRDKKLTVGDICIFERVYDDEVKLKVSIFKSLN